MRYGVIFPQYNYQGEVRDFASRVEAMGYDHILTYEHVLGANPDRPGGWKGPYTYEHLFLSPFVLFPFWAALTSTIEFTTGILILPQRQTALVAKQAATLDVLSHHRLRLGVGIGWNKVEFEALGYDFHTRGRRVEEQVVLLRKLWAERLVTFEGEWDAIPDAGINPLPQGGSIPLWMGGSADVVLRRIARMADGWMPPSATPEDSRPLFDRLAAYCEAEGRDPGEMGIDVRIPYGEGQADQWQEAVDIWRDMGATHITLNTLWNGFTDPEAHMDAYAAFSEAMNADK